MLASIFGKVTASLGKTYVLSGLLPAAVLLLAVLSYFTAITTLSDIGRQLLTVTESWKSLAWLGAIWLALGFLFYTLRAPLFGLFQIIPTGPLGRRLLFRRIARRERLRRIRVEAEWLSTAIFWLTKKDLNRAQIGDVPFWLTRSYPGDGRAIEISNIGRQKLLAVDRTIGDALNLTVKQSDAIAQGIFALYRLAKYERPPNTELAIAAEIAGWRFAMVSREAKAIVEFVNQDNQRKIARAFRDCERFGQGPYIFPTSLGNLISALDDYGLKRYKIDTATIWDRLWWILPKDVKADVSDARLALETLLNILIALLLAIIFIAFAHVNDCGLRPVFVGPCDATRALIFAGCGLLLSAITYRGAAFAMKVLSIKMTSLIDMYRLSTLKQLGFSPKTVGEELAVNSGLKGLFTQATVLNKKLKLATAPEAQKSEESDTKSADKNKNDKNKEGQTGGADPPGSADTEPTAQGPLAV